MASTAQVLESTKQSNYDEIKVFISHRDSKCDECNQQLGPQARITLEDVRTAENR